jgi:hypothetical protein
VYDLVTSREKLVAGLLDHRLIAATRLILAISAVLILDYTSMSRFNSDATRMVLILYILYSAALYFLTARRIRHKQAIPIWSHRTDIVWYTLLLALSGGSHSIFFFGFFSQFWWHHSSGVFLGFVHNRVVRAPVCCCSYSRRG